MMLGQGGGRCLRMSRNRKSRTSAPETFVGIPAPLVTLSQHRHVLCCFLTDHEGRLGLQWSGPFDHAPWWFDHEE